MGGRLKASHDEGPHFGRQLGVAQGLAWRRHGAWLQGGVVISGVGGLTHFGVINQGQPALAMDSSPRPPPMPHTPQSHPKFCVWGP